MLPTLDLGQADIVSRHHPATGGLQLLTTSILKLLGHGLPADAFALVGITMVDLYPDRRGTLSSDKPMYTTAWVYTVSRATTLEPMGRRPSVDSHQLMSDAKSWRMRPVTCSESIIAFGIAASYGSNHLAEADARPFHVCPMDLRKLQWSIGFDVIERYLGYRNSLSKLASKTRRAGWIIGFGLSRVEEAIIVVRSPA